MQTNSSSESDYAISTDRDRLDVSLVHAFLSQSSYWARGRSRDLVATSIQNSLSFGVYAPDGGQVGFARIVTDYSTFAWLCDVFILEEHRHSGLGKRLVEAVVDHPDLKPIRRILLATADAHDLYRRYGGFDLLAHPERWMERLVSEETHEPDMAE